MTMIQISIAKCKPKRKPSRINKLLSMAFGVYSDKSLRDKETKVIKMIIVMTMTITTILTRRRITVMNNSLHLLQVVPLKLRRGLLG